MNASISARLGRSVLAAMIALASVAPGRSAEVLIGNLPGNDTTSVNLGTLFDVYAVSFTTPNVASELVSLQINLNTNYFSVSDHTIGIFSDDANVPGTFLVGFNSVATTNVGTTFTFLPRDPFTFSSNTKYWLSVDNTLDGSLFWLGNGGTPSGTATFGSYRFNTNDTIITWENLNPALTPAFQINVTPVPEPSSLALIAVGWLACRTQRRRSRS